MLCHIEANLTADQILYQSNHQIPCIIITHDRNSNVWHKMSCIQHKNNVEIKYKNTINWKLIDVLSIKLNEPH